MTEFDRIYLQFERNVKRFMAVGITLILTAAVIMAALTYEPADARALVIGLVLMPIALGSMAWGLHLARKRREES